MYPIKKKKLGTSLVVQWLRLHASNAGGAGSLPGWGTKIPHAPQHGSAKKKRNENSNVFTLHTVFLDDIHSRWLNSFVVLSENPAYC